MEDRHRSSDRTRGSGGLSVVEAEEGGIDRVDHLGVCAVDEVWGEYGPAGLQEIAVSRRNGVVYVRGRGPRATEVGDGSFIDRLRRAGRPVVVALGRDGRRGDVCLGSLHCSRLGVTSEGERGSSDGGDGRGGKSG